MPSIIIVGAGCFGISTAYHLLKRGYKDITVIDRSEVLPAPDAASTDYNKVVRSSYSDSFYAKFAQEAVRAWKSEEWGDSYHESGVLILSSLTTSVPSRPLYVAKSYNNDVALGTRVNKLDTPESIRSIFPKGSNMGSFSESSGYLNQSGGWANAAQGVRLMMQSVIAAGGTIVAGKAVEKLLQDHERTTGVKCADGTIFKANVVILATGSWTASTFDDLDLKGKCLATGRCIALLQLTKKEADLHRDFPVVLDFASGFTMFPPNGDNIVKVTVDSTGYVNTSDNISTRRGLSTPRTVLSHAQDGLRIPKATLTEIRNNLRAVCPDLAKKPFFATRLCWYTDSPDEDWVIGPYDSSRSLFLATGGSGHAFKGSLSSVYKNNWTLTPIILQFLPVIGSLVADAVENKMEPSLVKKFAVGRDCTNQTLLRFGGPQAIKELNVADLCSAEDLMPSPKALL